MFVSAPKKIVITLSSQQVRLLHPLLPLHSILSRPAARPAGPGGGQGGGRVGPPLVLIKVVSVSVLTSLCPPSSCAPKEGKMRFEIVAAGEVIVFLGTTISVLGALVEDDGAGDRLALFDAHEVVDAVCAERALRFASTQAGATEGASTLRNRRSRLIGKGVTYLDRKYLDRQGARACLDIVRVTAARPPACRHTILVVL